ncbi:MAG TPA: hypothetical protein VGI75_01300 [Pirellulales bacterium]
MVLRSIGRGPICCAVLWLAVVCGQAWLGAAQSSAADGEGSSVKGVAGEEKPAARAKIEEEPGLIYARDEHGRLVPLLGFSYEELQKLIRQRDAEKSGSKSGYSIGQLTIRCEIEGDHANLVAKFKIRLNDAGTFNIPLVGGGAVLREAADYRGAGQQQIGFDTTTGWYLLTLEGAARTDHEISLKLVAPLKTSSGQTRLELKVPAVAASELSLDAPSSGGIEVTDHSGIATTDVKAPEKGHQEIVGLGLDGAISLTWKTGSGDAHAVLEATGLIRTAIDSRSVQFDAALSVKSFGRLFDRFRVRLPPGAQLAGDAPTGADYTLNSTGDASTAIVEVQLAQKTAGPVAIRLKAERIYDLTQSNTELELAGFEVLEAAPERQWGNIAVAIAGDWQPNWGAQKHIRRTAELPEELDRNDVAAGFEYLSQPASLQVRLAKRRTRVTVEPEYVYFVDPQMVRLEARLKYDIRGAKASSLEVGLPGWEIDDLGPAEIIDTDTSLANRSAQFSLPLLQPTSGELELTIHAHRAIAKDTNQVTIELPQPAADVVAPALVAVSPADNTRLHAPDEELEGLSRTAVPPRMKLPPQEQPPLFFHAEQAEATLVLDIERLPQTISASVKSEVGLGREEIEVKQRFQYHVEHAATSEVRLDIPESIIENDHFELLMNNEPLAHLQRGTDEQNSNINRVRAELSEPHIGNFEIVAQYRLPQPNGSAGDGRLDIPLAMPAGIIPENNTIAIHGELAPRVQNIDDTWKQAELGSGATSTASPSLELAAIRPTTEIRLQVKTPAAGQHGSTTVERAWVQSWVSKSVRQERFVYRFTSTADEVDVTLPAEAETANTELLMDDRQLSATLGDAKLHVPISDPAHPHVLEIRYQLPNPENVGANVTVELPKIAGNVWIDRLYWQLVLPRNEHLISEAEDLTDEFGWQWMGWAWARRPAWEQADLEKWVGTRTTAALPEGTNRYLFSAMGNLPNLSARYVARWEVVLVCSAAALIIGLALIHTGLARRQSTVLVIGVLLLAASIWRSDVALLLGQAAVLGIVLLGIGVWLGRAMARRRGTAVMMAGHSSAILERSSAKTRFQSLELAAASTMAAAVPASSAPESE